jgi:hypothetical protein
VATPNTESTLVDLALAGTASHVERVVRAARQTQADPAETHACRGLDWTWADDGSLLVRARLAPGQGAVLISALAKETDQPSAGRPHCSAEQSIEDRPPIVPLAARRADALITLVTRPGSSASAISGAAQVVLHIDADQAIARLENGPALPPASAERIACSARVQALVKDRRGNPLHLGRTDIHNLLLLCDRRHRLIHDQGYSMRGSGNDVTFYRPNGRPIADAGPPTEGRPAAVYDLASAHGITITDESLTPTWGGERLDPTTILALLLPERPRVAAA